MGRGAFWILGAFYTDLVSLLPGPPSDSRTRDGMCRSGCADGYHRMEKLTSPYVDWLWLGNTVTLNKDWMVRGTVIPVEMFKMCLCSTKKILYASTVVHITYHTLGNTWFHALGNARFSVLMMQRNAQKTVVSKKDPLQKSRYHF